MENCHASGYEQGKPEAIPKTEETSESGIAEDQNAFHTDDLPSVWTKL
jgi:hypothetical protein